jgi:hypothetical protein
MSKLRDFFVTTIVFVPCLLLLANTVSEQSKKVMKPGIMKCDELRSGDRGYIRGVVTERKQSQYSWNQEVTLAESNSCSTIVTFSPNSKMSGLLRPGNKLKVAVKVDSDYSASLLNDDVSTDYTVLDENGELPPTQTIVKKLGKSLMPDRGKSLTINFDVYTSNSASYHFPKEVARKLVPNQKMKWYFQAEEKGSRSFIVSDVELVN